MSHLSRSSKIFFLCLVTGLVQLGCSQPTGEYETPADLIPLTGTVTLNGEPLAGATVNFLPQGNTTGTGGFGITDDSGKFTAQHYSQAEGLEPGKYDVSFSKLALPDGSPIPPDADAADVGAVQQLPPHLLQPESGKFNVTVESSPQDVKFELKGKK